MRENPDSREGASMRLNAPRIAPGDPAEDPRRWTPCAEFTARPGETVRVDVRVGPPR